MNVEVATGTTLNVFPAKFFANFTFAIFFVANIWPFIKENKWMFWVQGVLQFTG